MSEDDPTPAAAESTPEIAAAIFGERLPLAEKYAQILSEEGVVRGLIGPRELPQLWTRHLLNCAVVSEEIPDGASVIDIGSGAGLPGIPLAIARPDLAVTLIEPLLRRTTFLEEVVSGLPLDNVTVVRGRAEEKAVLKAVEPADVVTSRAVAPLERLAKWSAPLIRGGGRLVALKGQSAPDEIARDWEKVMRSGIRDLAVAQCGTMLETPTTLIVGRRNETARDARAARRAARRN
ncbi:MULTISPECIES: 16S rRNA (guanine(527)-N(7))-methyltransferase RsmG [Gordonia]|uniref:Ribosomal RNA small subunit methyltransferase G n=1 Tax=Gordonia sihwensis NBRC 108236 TaxID=1223544 RepID=L7LJP8_9ACTN|nr:MULTISPECIES: 16S rRNA (guanine(527)-N(7))-methyltransferase RsmG [Gordonia]AUH67508.1 16S rRNA (guanine(527)-N(7))-methyltransferase RsmG [Gordonia sp. YC-JH1]GAC61360.1 ribosomal RNA small subunit methyltransferase G [Gordonia sihwensis NBRC 108236]